MFPGRIPRTLRTLHFKPGLPGYHEEYFHDRKIDAIYLTVALFKILNNFIEIKFTYYPIHPFEV